MIRLRKETWVESQSGFRKDVSAVYEIALHNSLADVSLEVGDTLPEDSTYEIVNVVPYIEKSPKDKPGTGAGGKLVKVSAFKVDLGV